MAVTEIKTANEILIAKAIANNDGFTAGQIKWIVEAMEEYAKQFSCEGDNDNYLDHPDYLKSQDAIYNKPAIG